MLWLFGLRETSPGQVREQQDTDNGIEDDPQETEGGGPGEAVEGVVRQEGRGGGGVVHCLQEHPAADLLQRRCKQKRISTSRVQQVSIEAGHIAHPSHDPGLSLYPCLLFVLNCQCGKIIA